LIAYTKNLETPEAQQKKVAYPVYCRDAKMLIVYKPPDSTNKYNDTKLENIKKMP